MLCKVDQYVIESPAKGLQHGLQATLAVCDDGVEAEARLLEERAQLDVGDPSHIRVPRSALLRLSQHTQDERHGRDVFPVPVYYLHYERATQSVRDLLRAWFVLALG